MRSPDGSVDDDAGAFESQRVDGEQDLRELALVSPAFPCSSREHHVGKINRLLPERGYVDNARRRSSAATATGAR
jgi:hypothetical protein